MSVMKNAAYRMMNRFDCHTNPIVIFESDDWGSIRVPSKEALRDYCAVHPEFHPNPYQTYDGLERYEDYDALKSVLTKHVDDRGHYARFTLNFVMANPVFNDSLLINRSFQFESIADTYKRYFGERKTFLSGLLDEVNNADCVFRPQLHGREHLNATVWMKKTIESRALLDAYLLKMIGVNPGKYSDMDVLNSSNTLINRDEYIRDAVQMFRALFGFSPQSFIAPCYVIDRSCESVLANEGVTVLQGARFMNKPRRDGSLAKIPWFMGWKNPFGQTCLVRNCYFEPTKSMFVGKTIDMCVDDSFAEIASALDSKRPAIVCSHRMNYTSIISCENRDSSLIALDKLLTKIEAAYPSVEYMSSDELVCKF